MNRSTYEIRRSMIEVARRHTRAMQEMSMRTVLDGETFAYFARPEKPATAGALA